MRFATGILLAFLSLVACSKKDDNAGTQQAQNATPVVNAAATSQPSPQVSDDKSTPGMVAPPAVTPPSAPLPAQPATNPYAAVMPAITGQIMAKTTFTCEDKTTFATQFENGPNQARVTFAKQAPVILPQAYTPNGFLYKTAQFELRGNGALANWTVTGRNPVRCRALP